MLGQYLSNAYFPQISPEGAYPVAADLLAAAIASAPGRRSRKPSSGESDPSLEETALV